MKKKRYLMIMGSRGKEKLKQIYFAYYEILECHCSFKHLVLNLLGKLLFHEGFYFHRAQSEKQKVFVSKTF